MYVAYACLRIGSQIICIIICVCDERIHHLCWLLSGMGIIGIIMPQGQPQHPPQQPGQPQPIHPQPMPPASDVGHVSGDSDPSRPPSQLHAENASKRCFARRHVVGIAHTARPRLSICARHLQVHLSSHAKSVRMAGPPHRPLRFESDGPLQLPDSPPFEPWQRTSP